MFISFDCCSGVVWREEEEEEAEVNIPGSPWVGELDDVRERGKREKSVQDWEERRVNGEGEE